MSVNITAVDEFTEPVQAPDDGDPANGSIFQLSPQALANRDLYLKTRLEEEVTARETAVTNVTAIYALYEIETTATAHGSAFDLTTISQDTGFVQTSNQVAVPSDGLYEFNVSMRGTSDDAVTTYYQCAAVIKLGGVVVNVVAFGARNTANASGLIVLNGSFKKRFASIGSDKFTIEFLATGSDIFTPSSGADNTFSITRLGP